MARDDWKYFDEDADMEGEEEEKKPLSPEMQCRNCLHWIPRDSLSCSWCGKVFEEKDRNRP